MHNYMRLAVIHIDEADESPFELKIMNKVFCSKLPKSLQELSSYMYNKEEADASIDKSAKSQ
jgi:hypothetical protein